MEDNIKRKVRNSAKKLLLVDMYGGKCSHCDYSNKQLLQFHHIDPSNKAFNIGRNDYRLSKLIEESKKCILLCGNCHVIEHSKKEIRDFADRKRKAAMLNYLGATCCSKCKESKSELILEFHHMGGEAKELTLNSYRGSYLKLSEDIKLELDKCIVLCRNCHFEEHFDNEVHMGISNIVDSHVVRELNVINGDVLVELRNSGNSISEIARQMNLNKSTVSTILTRLGMGIHKVSDLIIDRMAMKKHIDNGLNNAQIARLMECCPSVVSRYRKKLTSH